jgi:hypothetical protein
LYNNNSGEHNLKKTLATLFIVTCVIINAFSSDARAVRLLKQVDNNLDFGSSISFRKLINIEPSGNKKEFILKSFKKDRTKRSSIFLSPASDKDRVTLRIGDDIWLYIPSAGRPVRVPSLQSVTGGVFNNSDLHRLDYSEEYTPKVLKENAITLDLYLKAKNSLVAYDHLIMTIRKAHPLPLKIECYSSTNILIKVLHFKNMRNFGNGLVRHSVTETTSPLQPGYRSIMITGKIFPARLPADMFTQNYMRILSTRGR